MSETYITPEYQEQLDRLASTLCPISEVVEVNPLSIPRGDDEPLNRWDSLGTYLERE